MPFLLECIGPISVVRDRLWVGGKTGQDQAILTYKGDAVDSQTHGEGNPLACACGIRGPSLYGEGDRFFP